MKTRLALALCATGLISCTSTPPVVVKSAPPTSEATEKPTKPAHPCVTDAETQRLVVQVTGGLFPAQAANLNYCFSIGYRGINCGQDWEIHDAIGPISNRDRDKCDKAMQIHDGMMAAMAERKKQEDEKYDREHGLQPAK